MSSFQRRSSKQQLQIAFESDRIRRASNERGLRIEQRRIHEHNWENFKEDEIEEIMLGFF